MTVDPGLPVVVVGGGPAGAAAALALRRGGRRVVLLEAASSPAFRVGETLPAAAMPLLRDLGVLDRFHADGHLPSPGTLSAWGSSEPRAEDAVRDPHGRGWHLDRARFDAMLREAASDAGAEVRSGVRVVGAERVAGGWSLRLRVEDGSRSEDVDRPASHRIATPPELHDSGAASPWWFSPPPELGDTRGQSVGEGAPGGDRAGRDDPLPGPPPQAGEGAVRRFDQHPAVRRSDTLRCAWIVDATGRGASVARRLGAERVRDDALVAFWARFRPSMDCVDRDGRTMVEAAPDGWWYGARLPSGERIVAFLTDADLADRPTLLSAGGFAARLEESRLVGGPIRKHRYRIDGRPWGTDAASSRLDHVVGDGWTAAGDAALAFDPLSSQGILNALYLGLRAGEAVDAALSDDASPSTEYARRVKEIGRAYRRNRAAFYGMERRWEGRAFWRRRLGVEVETAARSASPADVEAGG